MSFISLAILILAAGSLPVFGAPIAPSTLSNFRIGTTNTRDLHFATTLKKRASDVYVTYSGAGTSFPDESEWVSTFDEMFTANNGILAGGCTQFGVAANSAQEISDIGSGIQQVAGQTGLDSRFILAILLQESNGCTRAPTTNYGVRNPGLMQSHNGANTCNDAGTVQNPCPASTITGMINDGVAGTSSGDGLKQTLAQAPGTTAAQYFGAARIYNSGSIAANGNLDDGIATHCYVSDVANRLTGWVFAQKECTLDGAVPAPAAAPPVVYPTAASSPSVATTPAQPTVAPVAAQPTAAPAPPMPTQAAPAPALSPPSAPPAPAYSPVAPVAPVAVAPLASAVAPSTNNQVSSGNMAPGVTTNCAEYYTVQDGDYCYSIAQNFSTTFEVLQTLNTQLDATCSNLWKGYDYCVKGS